jgi:hypothetical protein
MVHTFYANEAWASVFLGWLLKALLLRYGGARLYRAARPAFMGMIVGEAFAAGFWALEAAVRIGAGVPFKVPQIQPY